MAVNILTWNIEGLHKYQDNTDLKNYFMKFDIVALCETWGNFAGDFDNFFSSYLSFDCVRKKKPVQEETAAGYAYLLRSG